MLAGRQVLEAPCFDELADASETTPSGRRRFEFVPSDFPVDWLGAPVTFEAAGGETTEQPDPWFLHANIALEEINAAPDGLEARVRAPRSLAVHATPRATVDGADLYCAIVKRERDSLTLFIPRSVPLDAQRHQIDIRFALTKSMVGCPQTFQWSDQPVHHAPGGAGHSPPSSLARPDPAAQESAVETAGLIDIVIPVHNALEALTLCLDALERTRRTPWRLHLVDDASDPPTREFLVNYTQVRAWASVQRFERNVGYTKAVNAGLRSGRARWVVVMNSDALVTEGWLETLLECALSSDDIAAVGPLSNAAGHQSVPRLLDEHGSWCVNQLPPDMTADVFASHLRMASARERPDTEVLNGFCTLFRRSAVEVVGLFDDLAFPLGYGEETDLCYRLRQDGKRLVIADDVYVHHLKSASFGDERRRRLSALAGKVLRYKHPEYDGPTIRRRLLECPALSRLRRRLTDDLQLQGRVR